jgi:hypothetical protein
MRPSKNDSKRRFTFDRLESRQLLALVLSASDITATQQSPFKGVVAILADSNPAAKPSDYNNPPGSVLIDWGDGTPPSAGTVVDVGVPGMFLVDGTHTYIVAQNFPTTVTVTDQSSETASASGSVQVSPATSTPTTTPTLTIGANAITGTAGQSLASGTTVATFLDSNNLDANTSFNALISWGDGQTSAGQVLGGNGLFTVEGTNTYASAGTYTTTVMIVGVGTATGLSGSATGVASISNPTATSYNFSGMLAPIGNGPYYATSYTNTNQPTFMGMAQPFSTVALYAKPFGIDTQMPLGETVANANGQWALTTGPLAPLTYTVTATVTPSGGYPSNMMLLTNNDVVHIAMAPKKVKVKVHEQKAAHHRQPSRRQLLSRAAHQAHELQPRRAAKTDRGKFR